MLKPLDISGRVTLNINVMSSHKVPRLSQKVTCLSFFCFLRVLLQVKLSRHLGTSKYLISYQDNASDGAV